MPSHEAMAAPYCHTMRMHKYAIVAALAAVGILTSALSARAQDADAKKKGGDRRANVTQRVENMTKELNLNAEQQKKLTALFEEQGKKMQGMRDLTQEERREKARGMREEVTAKLKTILTSEQYEKWQSLPPEKRRGAPPAKGEKGGERKRGEGKKKQRE